MGLNKLLIRDALLYKNDEKKGQFTASASFTMHDLKNKQLQYQINQFHYATHSHFKPNTARDKLLSTFSVMI